MEQWRQYAAYKEIFEDTQYISQTLGFTLPVSEDGSLLISEELRSQIIQEHLLFEGFLDSMKNWVKDKVGEIPNLFKTIYKIMKDRELIEDFRIMVLKKIIKPLRNTIVQTGEKLKRASQRAGQAIIDAASNMYNMLSQDKGWKALLASMTVAVLFSKAVDMGIEELAKQGLKAILGAEVLKRILGQASDFNNWLTALTAGVGAVSLIANALAPATKAFLAVVAEGFKLNEKATSKDQQKYFGILKRCKEEGECPDEEIRSKASKMTTKQIDDFAGTKHKGLPDKVKNEELRNRIKEAILDRLSEEPAKGKKYSKTVTNPETGRKKKVSYGAKGYRIAPGTSKGDRYCARSWGIKQKLKSKKDKNDPNTPNNLSRKKWKCHGKKSRRDEEFTTDEIRMVIEDVIAKLDESGKCQKGYKTHDTQKTKTLYGKQYRNCVPNDESLRDRVRQTIERKLEEKKKKKKKKKKKGGTPGGTICKAGKEWAKRKFDTYPSVYANLAASAYCTNPNYAKKDKARKKNESKEEFGSHMMYDPKSGDAKQAKTEDEHNKLAAKGYVHVDPEKIRKALEAEGGAAGTDAVVDRTDSNEKEVKKAMDAMPDVAKHKKGDYIIDDDESIKVDEKKKGELQTWLDKKWKRVTTSGKIAGECGTSDDTKNPDRCLPASKAHSMTKGERAATARKKKAAQKSGEDSGKTSNVKNTKKGKVTKKHSGQ